MQNYHKGAHRHVMVKKKPKKGPAITHSDNESIRWLQQRTGDSIAGFYADMLGGADVFAQVARELRRNLGARRLHERKRGPKPHQGTRECERRRRQWAKQQAKHDAAAPS
jgi:hypothetical protein